MNSSLRSLHSEILATLLFCFAPPSSRADEPAIHGSWEAEGSVDGSFGYDLTRARGVALEQLKRPGCRSLFSDLRDARGRTLEEILREESDSVAEHLLRMSFRDGSGDLACSGAVAAFTSPGSFVIFLCVSSFQRIARRDPFRAGNVLIHEELHTLGLPEARPGNRPPNLLQTHEPPLTSLQINDLVASRCRL